MDAKKAFATAIRFERRQNWSKALRSYIELIRLIRAAKVDENVDVNGLRMLLYESHFHCGMACYHLRQMADAIQYFTGAMQAVGRKKIGCGAGCITGKVLHLHVPALARTAACYIQQGQFEMALKEIEQALVLDFQNPDLFCIRACAFYLLNHKEKAMKDANYSVWLNPRQVCAWLLRGIFRNLKDEELCRQPCSGKLDFEMGCRCNVDALNFTNVRDLASCAPAIFNRFLPSLRVSHTISVDDVFHRSKNNEYDDTLACNKRTNKMEKCRDSCRGQSAASTCAFVCGTARPLRTYPHSSPLASYSIIPHSSTSHHITSTPIPDRHAVECRVAVRSAPSRSRRISGLNVTLGSLLYTDLHTGHRKRAITSQIRQHAYGGHLLPARSFTVRSTVNKQERQHPRPWTQNTIPVQIPDIRGCRTLSDNDLTRRTESGSTL